MNLYLDASAWVKYHVAEDRHGVVVDLVDRAEVVITSALTLVEAHSAVARQVRDGLLSGADAGRARLALDRQWATFVRVDIVHAVVAHACDVVHSHNLRALDAIHVATAQIATQAVPGLVVLTYDRKMLQVAQALGLDARAP